MKKNQRYYSYTVYKNEFHPLFIAFLKGVDNGMTESCNTKYNFFREVLHESGTRLTLNVTENSVRIIQEAMFRSASWLAKDIWENQSTRHPAN
ncbi:MAG: hypothetical protein LBB62_05100 [Proteiniphilum sp.]|jgi:hypothetical protein|nr:hypothetical protein [Proteiniphilum sp.]